jgi:putative spermidine/putrescine transport system ATP-binding protein
MSTATAFDLKLDAVTQRYKGAASAAVDAVTLDIAAGELVALLGPSGCGKTTLLRIIAGFVQQTEGRVVVGGRPIDGLPPHRREVGVVFQNYALFPHMTAFDNVAYGLAARGAPQAQQQAKAREMLELVQMMHLAERLPREMSGGQQQRVALARALAVGPRILLLDEPFAALDKSLRLDMQIEVKRIQRMAGITCIMVTHDQEEALSMADRVAVINLGRLEQFAPPNDVYDLPGSLFVNRFVGTSNALRAQLVAAGDAPHARVADGPGWPVRSVGAGAAGSDVLLCVRPEHLRLADSGPGLAGTIELSLPLGPQIVHEVRLADGQDLKVIESRSHGARLQPPGRAVTIALAEGASPNAFPSPRQEPAR